MKTILSLYKKELMDILRDKKTIIMMVVLPILLYPLLMIGGVQLGTYISSSSKEHKYNIAIDMEEGSSKNELESYIKNNEDYNFNILDTSDYLDDLKNNKLDCFITDEKMDNKISYKINYIGSESNSSNGELALKKVLEDYNLTLSKEIIKDAGLDVDETLKPIEIKEENYASNEQSVGNILGMIIPMLLIVSILLGAIYPAIDTTAGERERGTLETILTLPVSNKELIFSKFLAVSTISVISAIANILSMSFVGIYMYNSMKSMLLDSKTLDINVYSFVPAVIIVFLCVITFALFITSLAMSVCIFAKTFKEAQNYITPLMLVLMMLSYISFIPNVSLTKVTAIIPVVNLALLIKEVMLFKINIGVLVIVLLSNIFYSFVTVMFLSKVYNSENILFGSNKYEFKLFERRANIKKGGIPSIQDSILILGIGLILIIYIGSYFQFKYGLFGALSNQVILLVISMFYIIYTKCNIKNTLSLRKPKVLSIIASIILWLGTFILINLISIPLQRLMPESAQNLEVINNLMEGHSTLSLIIVVALIPAIVEELFFRGFVFSAAKEKFNKIPAIIFVSLIFGLYHMSFIKMFTVGILGAALAISVYYSKSIATSMIMHFLNNAVAVVISVYGNTLVEKIPFVLSNDINIVNIIIYFIFSIIFIALGIILLRRKSIRSC